MFERGEAGAASSFKIATSLPNVRYVPELTALLTLSLSALQRLLPKDVYEKRHDEVC